MNYTLHQLRVFLEVVRQQSITRAAEELHLTQPAISIQLKNLQMQFEIPLTEIIGKRLYVTDYGRAIAEIAENVLNEADAIRYRTKEFIGLLAGKLRISSASTGKYVIPHFLGGFLREHPAIDLILDVTNKQKVMASLEKNEIDFAVVSVLPDQLNVYEELLLDNELYLVGSTPEFKADTPLLFREEGSATRMAMASYFPKDNLRKCIELTSNEAIKQGVMAGLGISIIPLIGIKNDLQNGDITIIPAAGLPIVTTWRLIWMKSKRLSPVAQAYLEYVRHEKDNIIANKFKKVPV